MKAINYLLGYKDKKIVQDTEMFNFSLDSVLLPNFVTLNKNITKILDIGTGNAPIPLILSTKTEAQIDAIELQNEVYEMAKETVEINNLQDRIKIIEGDINQIYKNMETETYDVITCNPPYFKVNTESNLNKSDYKTIARHEITLNLEQLMIISKKILKNNGIISLVHRPERLIEIIELMKKHHIEPKRIQLIYPKIDKESNVLLIEGTKNGKPGLKILPPIYTHNDDGSYTNTIKKYFE